MKNKSNGKTFQNGKQNAIVKSGSNAKSNRNSSRKNKNGGKVANDNFKPTSVERCSNWDAIKSNDIAWYNKMSDYLNVTRVPFNRIAGDPVRLRVNTTESLPVSANEGAIPGIMRIEYYQGPGTTVGGSESPVNRAFTSLYSQIYSETTGAMQFQQMDLAFLLTAFSSISGTIAFIKRAIETSNVWDAQNYYTPEALLTAMGVDPDSVFGHQDELISRLSYCIDSFNRFKLPDVVDTYKRNYALNRNLYLANEDGHNVFYIFKPINYYVYRDAPESGLPYLEYKELPSGTADLRSYIECVEEALAAWRNSSDLGLLCGSIQRAFKNRNFVMIDHITHDDVPRISTDRNILWQINNSNSTYLTDMNITQNPVSNSLVWAPTLDGDGVDSGWKYLGEQFLNSYDGNTDSEFIMEATRLMSGVRKVNTDDINASEFVWNPEVVKRYVAYYFVPSSGQDPVLRSVAFSSDMKYYAGDNYQSYLALLGKMNVISFFKHAPRIRLWLTDGDFSFMELTHQFGLLTTWTTIDGSSLYGLNRSALSSLYADAGTVGK